jgi:hypothetical protein
MACLGECMIRHRVVPILLLSVCLAGPALAQINPFRGSNRTPLNADDIEALTAATNRLLDRPQLVAGGSESWNNPKSGASGTVTAGNPVKRQGLACRTVRYQTTVPGPHAERSASLVWCKTKGGWKTG